jgi:hypothetical protein
MNLGSQKKIFPLSVTNAEDCMFSNFALIRECPEAIGAEGKLGCKARLRRIVNKQIQCYSINKVSSQLTGIDDEGIDPSNEVWLDPDYLYRINYGPASRNDVEVVYKALQAADNLSKRSRITLLDRSVAQELCKTLFLTNTDKMIFCTDWTAENEARNHEALVHQRTVRYINGTKSENPYNTDLQFGRRLSPFEFNPFATESEFLRAYEEFCVNCVWIMTYASAIFGQQDLP